MAIGNHLLEVWKEAEARGYSFARHKVRRTGKIRSIPVNRGRMKYEWEHLWKKLQKRDPVRFKSIKEKPKPTFFSGPSWARSKLGKSVSYFFRSAAAGASIMKRSFPSIGRRYWIG